ncbi:hypothetical protein IPF37_04970 [bacterium]|nr:MAG: hypothetical protein IPF37_04970 [bacterium]
MEKKKLSYLKYIALISFVSFNFFYYISIYGIKHGTLLALLIWSCYALCIPAGHGQLLLGFPLRLVTDRPIFTEPFFWSFAVIINIFSYFFEPYIYYQTIPTYLLYRIIVNPNPYWLIFLVSGLGTFFTFIINEDPVNIQNYRNKIIRHLLILFGILNFLYFSHQEFIIILNNKL